MREWNFTVQRATDCYVIWHTIPQIETILHDAFHGTFRKTEAAALHIWAFTIVAHEAEIVELLEARRQHSRPTEIGVIIGDHQIGHVAVKRILDSSQNFRRDVDER